MRLRSALATVLVASVTFTAGYMTGWSGGAGSTPSPRVADQRELAGDIQVTAPAQRALPQAGAGSISTPAARRLLPVSRPRRQAMAAPPKGAPSATSAPRPLATATPSPIGPPRASGTHVTPAPPAMPPTAAPAPTPPAGPPPRIRFTAVEHRFGEVPVGESVVHEFAFANEGEGSLTIGKVTTGCGCTAAVASASDIPPGGKGTIRLTFGTSGYKGETSKQAYVETNDPSQPRVTLTLSGKVQVALDVEPAHDYFNTIAYGATHQRTIRVFSPQGQTFKVTGLRPGAPAIRCSEVRPSGKGGYEFEVTVGPDLPSGQFSGSVVVETDLVRQPRLVIGVFGNIGPAEQPS